MVELKSYNGCVIQASDEAVPRLLAAGYVRVNQTASIEHRKKPASRRTSKQKE